MIFANEKLKGWRTKNPGRCISISAFRCCTIVPCLFKNSRIKVQHLALVADHTQLWKDGDELKEQVEKKWDLAPQNHQDHGRPIVL